MRYNIIKFLIIFMLITGLTSFTTFSATYPSTHSLVSLQPSSPVQISPLNHPFGSIHAKVLQWGSVTLVDGEVLEGQINYDQFRQTAFIIYTDKNNQLVYEYISKTLITSIELNQKKTEPAPEIESPIQAELLLLDGKTFAGIWEPGSPSGYIKIKPEGFQPLMIPSRIVSRITLRGNIKAGDINAQDSNKPKDTVVSSSIATKQETIQDSTVAVISNSPVSVLPFMNITLKDGNQRSGLYTFDPVKNVAVLISATDDGKRQYDFISGNFVQHLNPIPAEGFSQNVYSDQPIQQPITVHANDIFGNTIEGKFIQLDQNNQIHVLHNEDDQPLIIPMQNLLIVTLKEQAEPIHSVSVSNTEEESESLESVNELKALDTVYQTIAIGPLPKKKPVIPPLHSSVRVETNLNQLFIGELVTIEKEWIGVMVSQLGQMTLSPPQYSVINRTFLIQVETVEQNISNL